MSGQMWKLLGKNLLVSSSHSHANYYYSAIFFPPPRVDSLYDLIWLVGVNDFILKFVCVILKVFLVLVPMRFLPYQKRVRKKKDPFGRVEFFSFL